MCFTGTCPFEDVIGNCTITDKESLQLKEKFSFERLCPSFPYDDPSKLKILNKATNWLLHQRNGGK